MKYPYNDIEDVHHVIQDFEIQTNAKFSVTQRKFCEEDLLTMSYFTLL